jgi:hypothetical protein
VLRPGNHKAISNDCLVPDTLVVCLSARYVVARKKSASSNNLGAPGSSHPRASWRLTIAYNGDNFRLLERRWVRMITPPTAGSARSAGRDVGRWLEVRDARGKVLYHRDIDRLVGAEVEVFEPDGSIRHFSGPPREGQFEVVVPDYPAARAVCVLASPSGREAMREPARDVARFSLRDGTGGRPTEK